MGSGEEPDQKDEKRQDYDFFGRQDLASDYFQSITRKNQPVWCRIIWAIVIVGCVAFTIHTVYNLLSTYFEYKSYDQVTVTWKDEMVLPALTICNHNYINSTKFIELVSTMQVGEGDLVGETGTFIKEMIEAMERSQDISEDAYNEMNNKFHDVKIKDVASDFSEYFLGDGVNYPIMKFARKWLDPTTVNMEYKNTQLGNCLLLNDDQALVQRIAGPQGGFTIDLNARPESYLASTSSYGFVLFLRMPYAPVYIDMGGIDLHAGKEIFVPLRKEKLERLEEPYGDCQDKNNILNNSLVMGMRGCIQNEYFVESLDFCECSPWYFTDAVLSAFEPDPERFDNWMESLDMETNFTYDTMESLDCSLIAGIRCDLFILEQLENLNVSSVCHEQCSYDEWEHDVILTEFPSTNDYFGNFLGGMSHPDSLGDHDSLFDYAKKNYVRLHVYYEDLKEMKKSQTAAYDIYSFISEFGGSTDLLIGLSFFTVFQLMEICIAYLIFKCCHGKKDQGKQLPEDTEK